MTQLTTNQHILEIISRLKEKKIKQATYLWETQFNKGLEEAIFQCINQIKKCNEGAANTNKKNKAA
jgi:uncharacterized protein with von Willebrand factor type A (vWA) domain